MMTRQKYLRELNERIHFLPTSERESALRYCEEYFDEAGEENFEHAIQDLGTPEQFASQTIQNSNSRQSAGDSQVVTEHRKNKKLYWIIPLVIIASPLILILTPIAILLFVIFLFIICLPVLILAFLLIIFISLAVALAVMSFRFMFVEVSTALLLLGGALVLGSLFLVALTGLVQLIKIVFPWLAVKLSEFFLALKERREARSNEI